MRAKLHFLSSCAVMLGAGLLTPAHAQSDNTTATNTDGGDIIITARRREETIIEVPSSVAVVNSAAIDRLGITNFQDLALAIPNVTIFSTAGIAGRTQLTIRGVPDRAGIYVDDVFVGDATGISGLLIDIDRVEVIRGPQGALFGRNAISGAVNTVTRRPSETFQASALARIGNYDLRYVAGYVTGPINDSVRVKLSGAYRSETSYDRVRNFPPQKQSDTAAFLFQVEMDLASNLTALASVDFLQDNGLVAGVFDSIRDYGANGAYYRIAATDGNGYDRVTPQQNRLSTADRQNAGAFLRLDWDAGEFGATSITAARDIAFLYQRDGDYSPFQLLNDGYQPVNYNSFSQEVRLTWDPSPVLSVLLGGFFFRDHRISRDANTIGNDFVIAQASTPTFGAEAPALVPGGTVGGVTNGRLAVNPTLRGLVAARLATNASANLREFGRLVGLNQIDPNNLGRAETFSDTRLNSLAFFGTVSVRPLEGLEITGGLRYTREKIRAAFGRSVTGLYRLLSFENPRFELPQATDTDWSPSASIRYSITRNLSIYASYSTGFRSGGYNTAPGAAIADPITEGRNRKFAPERVTNYEIGAKASLAGGRLFISTALFQMDYRDLQRVFYRADPVLGQITQTLNTTATSRGFEIEASFDLRNGLTGGAAWGHAVSTYDDYPLGPVGTTTGVQQVRLTGLALPFTPRDTVTANLRYETPVSGDWRGFASGDIQHRSPYRVGDFNNNIDPEINIGSTTLLNASIGVTNPETGITITARVNNIGNSIYRTNLNINGFPGVVQQSLSAPRTYSLEGRIRF